MTRCKGTLTLEETVVAPRLTSGKRPAARVVVLGRGSLSVARGKSATVRVLLNAAGRRALVPVRRGASSIRLQLLERIGTASAKRAAVEVVLSR